jgi:hypothetical protein
MSSSHEITHNPSKQHVDIRTKETWCRSYYIKYLTEKNPHSYNIVMKGYLDCRYKTDCHCAHSPDEIKMKSHIRNFKMKTDFSDVNLDLIRTNIIDVLEQSKTKINEPEWASKINTIHSLPFDELLTFWYNITCHHRSLSNDKHGTTQLKSKKQHWFSGDSSLPPPYKGYHYKEDVPTFTLENEEFIWAFERCLHMCPNYKCLVEKQQISSFDICCGDVNCKYGVHDIRDKICIENMLTGLCLCQSDEDAEQKTKAFRTQKKIFQDELDVLCKQLQTSVSDDGFQIKLTKKVKETIEKQITDKKIECQTKLSQMIDEIKPRKNMVHLTDKSLIPLSVRFEMKKKIAQPQEEIIQVKKIVKKIY